MLRPTADDLATRPIQERNPWYLPGGKNFPLSRALYAPQEQPPNMEAMTQWSPYGTLDAEPYYGGYDPLSESGHGVMHVPQADLYDASPNPWPNNGQYDRPNGLFSLFAGLLRLQHESSAHPGFMQPTGAGPTMLFHAPPIFSAQTTPIPAVGV